MSGVSAGAPPAPPRADRRYAFTAGRAAPIGVTLDPNGANIAVFSANAVMVELCLFDAQGRETQRLALPEREGDVWFGYVPGLSAGQLYGLRVHGPYRPDEGHRFNPNKLLLDPYARQLTGQPVWDDALMGYTVGSGSADLGFDRRDSAPFMPKCVAVPPPVPDFAPAHPNTPLSASVIYEAHVKGLTKRHPGVPAPGSYTALASDPMLEHFTKLGITAVELLPVHAFLTDRFLHDLNLSNYWGYQSIGFFAPDTRYMSGADIGEFRQMVDRLHGVGIEVLLDVVYNHTGEGNQLGPTLSFRGLDNASYYRLHGDGRYYIDDTGTGNTLNIDHPQVLRMVMDSLRYWVEVMGVDGFRFDLATALGRREERHGGAFDRGAAFFDALRQDPTLCKVKLIAEPWDIGPGGYQLGAFPPPFCEWNDKFRDGVRRFWRGDPGRSPDLADRLTGSALQFDHSGRAATASVNLITCHDGFTLEDVVSYSGKHNEANGEGNRDGHSENFSDNMGQEGPTAETGTLAARARRKRAMLATMMLSQGTPMLLAGDELGHSQGGNNNAYAQDNETTWVDWESIDDAFLRFASRLISFRRAHPILRQKLFLHAGERAIDGKPDLFWWCAEGKPMTTSDWLDPQLRLVCAEMRTAQNTPGYAVTERAIFSVFNAGTDAAEVVLPEATPGRSWLRALDTDTPEAPARRTGEGAEAALGPRRVMVAGQSVAVFVLALDP
ncbi:MAG: glycogen debranching protein GlgX [Pseudomonadota bacterium]